MVHLQFTKLLWCPLQVGKISLHYPECPPERRRIIHRGVDPAEFPWGYRPSEAWQREFLQTLPADARDCALITLPGRITRWKGQLDFLDVVEALVQRGHRVHGLIVGGTEKRRQRYEAEVRQAIGQRGLDAHLSWLGQRSDLREIMAMSFAVLSLSRDPEAFGRVSLEALSLGRPVVAYDHGGVAEQIAELLPAGAMTPGQPVRVAARLAEWLVDGPPEPVRSPNFTLQAMQDQTLAVYRELIGDLRA